MLQQNIIFESDDTRADLRLIDFGFARLLPSAGMPLTTPCYTLHYAAPEVLDRCPLNKMSNDQDFLPQYNQQCDLWSLGVIIYIMLSGHVPFHVRNKYESATDIMKRIQNAEFAFDGAEWAAVSEDAKDLIAGKLNSYVLVVVIDCINLGTVKKLPNAYVIRETGSRNVFRLVQGLY